MHSASGIKLFDPARLFTPEKEDREDQLSLLKGEYEKIRENTQAELKKLQENIAVVERALNDAKNQQAASPGQDFLNKKISLLNATYQEKLNIQFTLKEIPLTIEQQIKTLEEYLKAPDFKALILEPRSFYPYDVVQSSIKKVLDQEERINNLKLQRNDVTVELENRKKKLASAAKDYQEKKKEQEEFSAKAPESTPSQAELSFEQRGEIIDLEERYDGYLQQLADLQVQATMRKIALLNTTIFVEEQKQKVLENNLARVKAGLRITETEVQEAKNSVEKRDQKAQALQQTRLEERKKLTAYKEKLKRDLEIEAKRLNMPVLEKDELSSWVVEQPSLESFTALCQMGFLNTEINVINRRIDFLTAEVELEKAKSAREALKFAILMTWHDLTHRKFKDNEHIIAELKKFKEREAEINRELSSFQDKRNAAINQLNIQNKELTNLRAFRQEVEKEREGFFRRVPVRFVNCLKSLQRAEKNIQDQIDINGKLIETYSNLIATLDSTIKEINIITIELKTKSIWQRSQYAISWQGVKNIIPDLGYFITDLYQIAVSFFANLKWSNILATFNRIFNAPGKILLWAIVLFLLISCFIFLRNRLPEFRAYLTSFSTKGFLAVIIELSVCTLLFIERYLVWLYIWAVIFTMVNFDVVSDLFLEIVFYLASIGYLIYFIRKFIYYVISYNRRHNYVIFAQGFERRFITVTSIFFYLTIAVLFFREAFILATVHKSELPTILLAGYSIFLRSLLIFSIGKNEILGLITPRGPITTWLAYGVEHYYYPILIAITVLMVMSDPYVGGYGNLVSYIIWGTIGTVIITRLLYIIHTYAKNYSEVVFFSTEEEVKRERFGYAKTWYGIFAIALFLIFILVGLLFIARIWHLPFSLEDIRKFFDYGIFKTGIESKSGEDIWFTPGKLFVLLGFVAGGFLAAVAFNRFVLHRIFDILPVDLGVQNTVVSITRYLIVIIFIYLGFSWANLGNLLIAIGIVIGSIGYIVKEPLGDFISYFIILVQRPIQIGDFIMLDHDTQGVVRKITPRSVILRRKNSYSIILPNSMILNRSVNNWSYGRNFIAFDDIYFTVNYQADPEEVRKLMHQILDESTEVLKSPQPIIRLHEFGEYGFVFMVRGFISNINILRQWDIASNIRFAIIATLRKHKISLAIPARVLLQDSQKASMLPDIT
ncbi:MAG: mechanosensitive ion channel domain-containing protein [Candidatus Babeliales bacterium]